jgi:hypothetical protein
MKSILYHRFQKFQQWVTIHPKLNEPEQNTRFVGSLIPMMLSILVCDKKTNHSPNFHQEWSPLEPLHTDNTQQIFNASK